MTPIFEEVESRGLNDSGGVINVTWSKHNLFSMLLQGSRRTCAVLHAADVVHLINDCVRDPSHSIRNPREQFLRVRTTDVN